MDKVTSPDGTPIVYYRSGTGSPLILVPGSGAANPVAWTGVIPTLEEHFSVYAVDRRGHGESGDSPIYAIEREFEDIAAVADSIGEPANLLGHSFGALCTLGAAFLTPNIRKLILYEPAIPLPGVAIYPEGVIDRLQALLEAGDREAVLTTLYHEVIRLPPHEIEQLRSSPAWSARVATAHTLPREARAEEQYEFDPQRFKDLQTPTLFLLGGDSPPFLKAATEAINTALPNGRVAVMPGQQHIAMYTAPELFLHNVLTFLI
ncbi:MAG: alpha/beta hydrolase [Chloroflexi bacterium]|nr:MAG: alpha/beta hydrolase [Chloroflexota bacterium]